jgi:citrate lyase gamma subunit
MSKDSQVTGAVAGALDAADVEIVVNPHFVPEEVEVPADFVLDKDEDAHE